MCDTALFPEKMDITCIVNKIACKLFYTNTENTSQLIRFAGYKSVTMNTNQGKDVRGGDGGKEESE